MPPPPDPSAPVRHAHDLPTLDADRLEELRDLCTEAGPGVLREMFCSWEVDTLRHLADARQSLESADRQALKAAAHALKGSCANLGIVRLAELGQLLEHAVEFPTETTALLAEIHTEFARARAQLLQAAG